MNLILCATPRSGSTLLCTLLRSSGVAGWPESWFRPVDMADYAEEWGLEAGFAPQDYLAAAWQAGRSANGVFGLRLMWDHLPALAECLGQVRVDPAGLAQAFGPCSYVLLTRKDLVAQAVSRHKAEVSGTWHLGIEEAAHPRKPTYDHGAIASYIAEAEADQAAWQAWFATHGVEPLVLTYEGLSAAPEASARSVLRHMGVPETGPLYAANRKMADAVSDQWAARFRSEADRAGQE